MNTGLEFTKLWHPLTARAIRCLLKIRNHTLYSSWPQNASAFCPLLGLLFEVSIHDSCSTEAGYVRSKDWCCAATRQPWLRSNIDLASRSTAAAAVLRSSSAAAATGTRRRILLVSEASFYCWSRRDCDSRLVIHVVRLKALFSYY